MAFTKNKFRILRCKNCNHHFTELVLSPEKVNEIYSDSYFYDGGDGYSDYTSEGKILVKHGEYYARKISKYINPGNILDVGAAAGFILKGFENTGWHGTGIEPNKNMVDYGIKNLGIDLQTGTIESFNPGLKFDLIIMIQVIAHLFDLNKSMKNVYDLLKPEGFVLIETWNRNSLTARFFGLQWHEYSPPSTLNYFSEKTLDILLTGNNFHKIDTGRPQKKIMSSHAKSLLKHKIQDSRSMKIFYRLVNLIPDNAIIPYPAEDLFWALYKKNI